MELFSPAGPGYMDNNREMKMYFTVYIDNNKQMKLYFLGCMDNNRK